MFSNEYRATSGTLSQAMTMERNRNVELSSDQEEPSDQTDDMPSGEWFVVNKRDIHMRWATVPWRLGALGVNQSALRGLDSQSRMGLSAPPHSQPKYSCQISDSARYSKKTHFLSLYTRFGRSDLPTRCTSPKTNTLWWRLFLRWTTLFGPHRRLFFTLDTPVWTRNIETYWLGRTTDKKIVASKFAPYSIQKDLYMKR